MRCVLMFLGRKKKTEWPPDIEHVAWSALLFALHEKTLAEDGEESVFASDDVVNALSLGDKPPAGAVLRAAFYEAVAQLAAGPIGYLSHGGRSEIRSSDGAIVVKVVSRGHGVAHEIS